MSMYRVLWTIDIEADTAEEAAQRALDIQRNPESIATVFEVTSPDGSVEQIDLEPIEA